MTISTRKLLLVIALLWFIAGINVLIIGLTAMSHWFTWWVLLGALGVFLIFEMFIFSRVALRYTKRIFSMEEEKMPFWYAFDAKGYLIIAVMMGGGIALRVSGIVPEWFIALFYSGLGAALFVTSVAYVTLYLTHRRSANSGLPSPHQAGYAVHKHSREARQKSN